MSEEFTVEVPVRYRDLDPYDHVNHAVYVSYLESARVAYIDEVFELSEDEISFVIANLEISYGHPITLGDEPVVALWVSDLGDSSCTMRYEIRVDGEVVSTAETVMVNLDPETERPAPYPDDVRERIVEYEGLETADRDRTR
ncbi:acyl-CoA thioesterase [Natrarchaeobius chitinivorans]|uniref:Acyl-CoA thioesterase n=1 Tax=Natrarchaeobius chitinivorans TaxID=1679083 RepID=A0A3N6LQS2_NATCH|nr:thioesterase family protein [Natrarchaeobius chitinivorans]RQG92003.1 acyl-CoA thioesterase [Natrarchaeobius chitinivorans]